MKCVACQADIEANSVFCPKCGTRLEQLEGHSGQEQAQEPLADEVQSQGGPQLAEQPNPVQRLRDTARAAATADTPAWSQGGYSKKTLRGRFLTTLFASILLLAFLAWAEWSKQWNWPLYPVLIALAALWIWYACVRIYRVGTIKYQLTAHQFYHEEGIFRRIRDVIEVIDIDDLKLERTLWDRIVNGGVGTVIVRSADQSSPELRLRGLEKPDLVFQSLDDARRKERTARGLKSV
ncbi:MAG: zinc ribbon domain-containing protein [Thermoguttaceae bacterium]